jgi:hypothetical protein
MDSSAPDIVEFVTDPQLLGLTEARWSRDAVHSLLVETPFYLAPTS